MYGMAPRTPVILAPVMAINADGGSAVQLADAKDFQIILPTGQALMRPPHLKGFAAGGRTHLLMEVVGGGESPRLFRVDVQNGKRASIHHEQLSGSLIYDWNGRPRLNRVHTRDGAPELFFRVADSGGWRELTAPSNSQGPQRFVSSPADYFGPRAIPLGLDLRPNVLIYAANLGRDTFGIYGLDLQSWQRTPLALEHPRFDFASLDDSLPSPSLVFDEWLQKLVGVRAPTPRPFTAWVDSGIADVQRALDERFPQRSVEILEWDEHRTRFLVRVTGGVERGRIYLCDLGRKSFVELLRLAPWLPETDLNPTRYFAFTGPAGAKLSGFLTLPRVPKINPPPLVIWFAPGIPPRPHPEFDPQAQVLADLGFIVCRLNNRGVVGTGMRDRDALRHDPNGVPALDAQAAIDWVAKSHPVDRKRVATFGEGLAGYFAIRVAQMRPDVFRCAIAFDPILNFSGWLNPLSTDANASLGSGLGRQTLIEGGPPSFSQQVNRTYLEGGGAKIGQLSLTTDQLNLPVFAATRLARNDMENAIASGVAGLRFQLKRRDIPCITLEFDEDFVQGLPGARARIYRALEEFINLNLYDYNVKVGPTTIVP